MTDLLTRYGVCIHCERPIHTVGRSPIHTESDQYSCEGGVAEFAVADQSASEIRDEAYDVGYSQGVDDTQEEVIQAFRKGRRELAKELDEWISAHRHKLLTLDDILDRLAEE